MVALIITIWAGNAPRTSSSLSNRLLKSLSIKQGLKYDAPESVRDIPPFIEFHNLNTEEILDPLESFSTFPPVSHAQSLTPSNRDLQRVLLQVNRLYHLTDHALT